MSGRSRCRLVALKTLCELSSIQVLILTYTMELKNVIKLTAVVDVFIEKYKVK